MTVMIKICGLRNRDIVNAAVAAGASAIGFVFAESPRQVSPDDARRAAVDIPENVLRVAVMKHPDVDDWARVTDEFQPDVLQTDVADFDYLDVADDIIRWPVIREGSEPTNGWPETFVYEGAKSGQGQRVDWQHAATVAQRGNMILAGGLNADNVAAAVAGVAPYGVDVSSGVETLPGEKDPRKIKAFIDAVNNQVQETTQ